MNIKAKLKQNFFVSQHLFKKRLATWMSAGFQDPLPQEVKELAIRYYAACHKLDTFIETGTYKGDMVWAQKDFFKQIFSIELSEDLYYRATKRFSGFTHIRLINGDSAVEIENALTRANSPALIYLDGHYSGGITALGAKECPIFEELHHIFSSPFRHFVIIDDARLFVGKNDYPTLNELFDFIRSNSSYSMRIEGDFIVLDDHLSNGF